MTNADIARGIAAEINDAHAALARANALATEEFRALVQPADLSKVETAHARATRAVNALHRAVAKAARNSGDVTVQSGGGGKRVAQP